MRMPLISSIVRRRLKVVALLALVAGCRPLETRSPIHMANPFSPLSAEKQAAKDREAAAEGKKEKIEFGRPETLAVIWTDSVYTAPGAQPTRGFGGRFFFYDVKGEAVRVDGELTVYGFDDSTEGAQSKVPQKKFVYPADQLQSHCGMSDLGISYNFWIPWDGVGGERKAISLLPILKTTDGRTIRGEQTLNVLPGRAPEQEQLIGTVSQIRQTLDRSMMSGESALQVGPNSGAVTAPSRTATIDVPYEMGRQMQQPQAPRTAVPGRRSTTLPESLPAPHPNGANPSGAMLPPGAMMPGTMQPGAMTPGMSRPAIADRSTNANLRTAGSGPNGYIAGGSPVGTVGMANQPVGAVPDPALFPFPTQQYDPATNTMTGVGPAPGFSRGPRTDIAGGRTVRNP